MSRRRKNGGRGEKANRRTRIAHQVDPGLRAILHAITQAHAPLTCAERGYREPHRMGGGPDGDLRRRAEAGCPTILHDAVVASIDKLRDARRMLATWSRGDVAAGDQLDEPGDEGSGDRGLVPGHRGPAADHGERLEREEPPLALEVLGRLRGPHGERGAVQRAGENEGIRRRASG
jgi:hypothetical protein